MKGKTCIIAKFHRIDLVVCSHFREGKTPSYSQINTVIHLKISHFLYVSNFMVSLHRREKVHL